MQFYTWRCQITIIFSQLIIHDDIGQKTFLSNWKLCTQVMLQNIGLLYLRHRSGKPAEPREITSRLPNSGARYTHQTYAKSGFDHTWTVSQPSSKRSSCGLRFSVYSPFL